MVEVWDAANGGFNVTLPSNETVHVDGSVTAEKVKELARAEGVRKFTVKTTAGATLTPTQFPYSGDVLVEEYNEAK